MVINLFPWRERQQVYERNRLRQIIFSVLTVTLLLLIAAHFLLFMYEQKIEKQVTQCRAELQRLRKERKLQVSDVQRPVSKSVLEKVLIYRADTQRVIAGMGKQHQYHVCFTAMTRANNIITITGNARSAAELTEFLKHWETASQFAEIRIDQLELQPETQLMLFRLQAIEQVMLPQEIQSARNIDHAL